jgi:hypothetical protein
MEQKLREFNQYNTVHDIIDDRNQLRKQLDAYYETGVVCANAKDHDIMDLVRKYYKQGNLIPIETINTDIMAAIDLWGKLQNQIREQCFNCPYETPNIYPEAAHLRNSSLVSDRTHIVQDQKRITSVELPALQPAHTELSTMHKVHTTDTKQLLNSEITVREGNIHVTNDYLVY